MITRHHIVLILMCTLVLGVAVFPSDIVAPGILAAGACIGAVLPDIHMGKPNRFGFRTFTWYITRFSAWICIPALCVTLYRLFGMNLCPSDKRLTHSVSGFFFACAAVAGIVAVPVVVSGLSPMPGPVIIFVSGILTGFFLHLAEDACTRKGVTPLYPFSTVRIAGSIRPCDRTDSRIARFQIQHCGMAVVVLALHSTGSWSESLFCTVSIVALVSCLGLMLWLSDIRIEAGNSAAGIPAVEPRTPYNPGTI